MGVCQRLGGMKMGKKLVKPSKLISGSRPNTIRSTKTGKEYFNPLSVKEGDIVEARFTNSGNMFRFPAKITKVNKETVRVVRIDGNPVWDEDDPTRDFVIPKLNTANNGIFQLKATDKQKLLKNIVDKADSYDKYYTIPCPRCGGSAERFEYDIERKNGNLEGTVFYDRHKECGYYNYDAHFYE
jgi:hypothetical protein